MLVERIAALNRDPGVHGILVQLPLPAQIDGARVLEAIDRPRTSTASTRAMSAGCSRPAAGSTRGSLVPCTPMGCLILLRQTLGEDLAGRRAIVLGRSNIVGKPVAALLLAANCTVTVAHSRTLDRRPSAAAPRS